MPLCWQLSCCLHFHTGARKQIHSWSQHWSWLQPNGFWMPWKGIQWRESECWCVISIVLALRSGMTCLNVCFSLSKIAKAEELKGASDKEKEEWEWDGNVPIMYYKVWLHIGAHLNLLWFRFTDSNACLFTDQGWENTWQMSQYPALFWDKGKSQEGTRKAD